jgi:hypothetical protein
MNNKLKGTILRVLYLLIVSLICLQLTGCAVGYMTFKTHGSDSKRTDKNIANLKFSYSVHSEKLNFERYEQKIGASFERILRRRFHILDVQQIPQPDTKKDPERYIVHIDISVDRLSLAEEVWTTLSIISFAAIPATADFTYSLQYSIFTPDGDAKIFHYSYDERSYSWLPFFFFGPRFLLFLWTEGNLYDKERIKVFDGITERFILDATPLLFGSK